MKSSNRLFILFLLGAGLAGVATAAEHRHDIVIYGGTAGGVVSAVTAVQEGASVILLEPTAHIGGMVTGGLGATDIGVEQSIGGMSRRFYERVYVHYQQPQAWKHETREAFLKRGGSRVNQADRAWWLVEPSVASLVLKQLAAEAKVTILTGQRLKSVRKTGARIERITTMTGDVFSGRVFIDATYEGDLLAMAGVPHRVDRESRAEYGEELAGVVPEAWSTRKQWEVDIRPYGPDHKLLFGVQDVPRGADGAGDRKVQAYNYRICVTDAPDNRIPISRPERYEPSRYELLALYITRKGDAINLTGPKGGSLLKIDPLPNRKTDINDGGPFSTDYIGGNWDYPEGDFATRQRILQDHVDYTKGLLFFLGHDERVPSRIRQQMQRWGYPKDEFAATGHWTPQVYVREARRMVGDYVMTQHDIQKRRQKSDSVGMGSYNADSHHLQRIVNAEGFVRNEGNPNDRAMGHTPYEIPYRCLTPRRADSDNLFATFCVSASHMGFASLRMEPVFMILSESAGVAAATAVKTNIAVQDVPVAPLQQQLLARGQRLWLKELPPHKKKS
ncbi:MAG: FAD-dependent oxidoreductase [Opitutaceae bacterium]|nr:FAD-dependent oxidoreductase [Opitutaceae bacterium]